MSSRGDSPNDAPLLIDAHGLCKKFKDFSLSGVGISVRAGEVVGFVGQNGAGKSTTIKSLLGLVPLDSGDATVLGVPVGDMSGARGTRAKQDIGVVFDSIAYPPHLSVAEIGRMLSVAYTGWDADLFRRYCRLFELKGTRTVKELSRGMGMKLGLACSLAHRPKLLLLDEATAGLDPMARDEVLDILEDYARRGGGILMSSHITTDFDKIATRVVCIDSGRIMFDVATEDVYRMGVAMVRPDELARMRANIESYSNGGGHRLRFMSRSGDAPLFPDGLVVQQGRHGTELMVPDRERFMYAYPDIPCDRMDVDEYMMFALKGRQSGDVDAAEQERLAAQARKPVSIDPVVICELHGERRAAPADGPVDGEATEQAATRVNTTAEPAPERRDSRPEEQVGGQEAAARPRGRGDIPPEPEAAEAPSDDRRPAGRPASAEAEPTGPERAAVRGDAVGGSRTEERPAPTPYTEPERHAPKRRRRMILPIEEPDDETTAAEAGGREPAANGTGSADDATHEGTPDAGTGTPGADEPHEPAMEDHEAADGHEPTARDDGGNGGPDDAAPHDADAPEHGHGDDHTGPAAGRTDADETASGKGDGTVDHPSSFRFDIPDLTMPRITFNGLPEADEGRNAR